MTECRITSSPGYSKKNCRYIEWCFRLSMGLQRLAHSVTEVGPHSKWPAAGNDSGWHCVRRILIARSMPVVRHMIYISTGILPVFSTSFPDDSARCRRSRIASRIASAEGSEIRYFPAPPTTAGNPRKSVCQYQIIATTFRLPKYLRRNGKITARKDSRQLSGL